MGNESGGQYSLTLLVEGGPPDDLWFGEELYEVWGADGSGTYEIWQTDYDRPPPYPRYLFSSGSLGAPSFGWEIGSLSQPVGIAGNDIRNSTVTVQLRTGGKSGSKHRNIFVMQSSATGYQHLTSSDYYIGYMAAGIPIPTDSYSVPPGSIKVAGKSLGEDGLAYVVFPDNATLDITPQAHANYYSFGVSASKYTPTITANGTDLEVTTPTFCIGQQVAFSLNWSPSAPPNVLDTLQHWTLPDKYVNQAYQPYPYSSVCTSYRINGDLLANPTTSCWFVNGSGGTVSMWQNLHFSNGQEVSIAADGKFTVVKPSIDNFNPSFQNYFNTNNGVDISASMNWHTFVRPPNNFSGYGTYVQLINRTWFYYNNVPVYGCINEESGTAGQYWLDNVAPYPDPNTPELLSWNDDPERHVDHSDTPGLSGNLCTLVSISDQFKTYLQFQPATSGSIPVTIGRVDWGWSCNATENNGIWTWNISTSGPTPDWSDDSFPVWPYVYYNN